MQLRPADVAVVVAYLAALSLIGAFLSKHQSSRAEYFLGGRQTHWLLAGGSILASLISSASFLYIPGEMIRYGISYFLGLAVLPLIIPVVTRVVLPIIHALPITSAYDYLEKRFAANVRRLAEAVFVMRVSLWMAIIIYTASLAVSEVTAWNVVVTVVLVGVSTTLYTTVGGFRTVVWTDNLQMLIMFAGAFAIPAVVWSMTQQNPVEWWRAFSAADRTRIEVFSVDPTVRMTLVAVVVSQFFWSVSLSISDQVVVQRFLATPTLGDARRSVWVATFLQMLVVASLAFCGLALFAANWHVSGMHPQEFQNQITRDADRLLPRFIARDLPTGLAGLLLAALLAAAMSSLSSGINSVSSVLSGYVSRRHEFPTSGSLRMEKWTAFTAGAGVTAAAWVLVATIERTGWNLLELSSRVGGLFVAPLAVPFAAGMLFRWVGTTAVLCGFAASLASSIFIAFGKELFGLQNSISFLWVVPVPFLLGLLCAGLAGLLLPAPSQAQIQGLAVETGAR